MKKHKEKIPKRKKKAELKNTLWESVFNAVRKREYISVKLYSPTFEAEIRTLEGGFPWESEVLVQLYVHTYRGYDWRQTFETVEEAREALNEEYRRADPQE